MAQQIQLRRDTTAAWTAANPVLAQGELAVETDSSPMKFKIGNGVLAWNALPYIALGGAVTHHLTHENGGSDEIDVTGLSGLLADPQTPAAHTHTDLTYLTELSIERDSSGLISGGDITVDPLYTTITIAAGVGYVNDGTGAPGSYKRVTWNQIPNVAMAGNLDNFIAINANGTADVSLTLQDTATHIILGAAYVTAGYIVGAGRLPFWVGDYETRANTWIRDCFGTLISSGLAVSEQATPNELHVNITAGTLYNTLTRLPVGATTSFTKIGGCSDLGSFIYTDTPDMVDVAHWNDPTQPFVSCIIDMTPGWWKKDVLICSAEGQLYYILGEAEYATEDDAKAGPLSLTGATSVSVAVLCTFVVQKGDASIASRIHDLRPMISRIFEIASLGGGGGPGGGIATNIGGNTDGTPAVISAGTVSFMGGNNITLSQNGSSITISGPNTTNSSVFLGTSQSSLFRQTSDNSQLRFTSADSQLEFTSANSNLMTGWSLAGAQTAGTNATAGSDRIYLSAGNMMTLSGNSNTIVLSMNSASLLGTGAVASFLSTSQSSLFRHTSADSQLEFTSANSNLMTGWSLAGAQTAGTNATAGSDRIYLSAGNMMTLSGNSNTIVLSMNSASLLGTGALASLLSTSQSSLFRHTSADSQLQFTSADSNFRYTSADTQLAFKSAGVVSAASLSGNNTAGVMAIISTGTLYLAGGNNVTLSQNANSITISGPNVGGAQTGISSIAASNTTYTSGMVIFSGLSNVTINSSVDGVSQFVQISAPSPLGGGAAIQGSGTYTQNTGTVQFQNSNNITFGLVTPGVMTASFSDTQNSNYLLTANSSNLLGTGATASFRFTSDNGQLQFTSANSNLMTGWSLAGAQTAGTNTSGAPGGLYLSAGNMMTLSGNSNTIVLSMNSASLLGTGAIASFLSTSQSSLFRHTSADSQLQFTSANTNFMSRAVMRNFEPIRAHDESTMALMQGTVYLSPIVFPMYMTATNMDILLVISNSSSAGGTISANVGLYTYAASTASSVSSTLWTMAYNSTLGGISSYTNISGTRYHSLSLGNWAITPGEYLVWLGLSVVTGLTSGSYSIYGNSGVNIVGAEYLGAGNDVRAWGHPGILSAATNAIRASIHISDIVRTGGTARAQPWMMFKGTF